MKEIELTRGYKTKVDDDDFAYLNKWNWKANIGRSPGCVYAETSFIGQTKNTLMHRLIMAHASGEPIPEGIEVFHLNRDMLDNRRENLRLVSRQQINLSKRANKRNTSGYKGVYFNKKKNKWQTQITASKKTYFLGLFDDPLDAARAYNHRAQELHGEFAILNNLDDVENHRAIPQEEKPVSASAGKRRSSINKSGYKGVSWNPRAKK